MPTKSKVAAADDSSFFAQADAKVRSVLDAARTLDEARTTLRAQARQNPAAFGELRLVDRNPTGQP